MSPSPPQIRRVALLIESSRAYGRGLLRGIAAYARESGNWSLRHQEMSINTDPPGWLANWKGDGVLVRMETPKMVSAIQSLGIPSIDLRCSYAVDHIPGFTTDDASIVRLAVDHFRDRGYTRFGFCGFEGANYSAGRLRQMRAVLRDMGYDVVAYESPGPTPSTTMEAELHGMLDEHRLSDWLASLRTPIGILASNDIRAQQMLNACNKLGIHIPDDIAVIGVDNDDVICPMCAPSLTSVEPNTHKIGYDAAAQLELMMRGAAPPEETTWVPAKRIVVRESTDAVAVDDPEFVEAYRYIRANASKGISVEDVAQATSLSRRSLERRMRLHLDRSPGDLIAAVRLAHIKELLEETSLPFERIASMTGFAQYEHLAKFFRNLEEMSPSEYRKLAQFRRQ